MWFKRFTCLVLPLKREREEERKKREGQYRVASLSQGTLVFQSGVDVFCLAFAVIEKKDKRKGWGEKEVSVVL